MRISDWSSDVCSSDLILEKDDRNRAVFVGLEREPDSAQGEPVERLVFVGRRMDRCEKTREALAGRRKKQHVGRLSPESHPDIERRRLLPARRRIIVVPRAILLEAEKVEDSAGVPRHLLVVANRAADGIDPAPDRKSAVRGKGGD